MNRERQELEENIVCASSEGPTATSREMQTSDPFVSDRSLILYIACVHSRLRLNEDDLYFFSGHWLVPYTFRDYGKFSLTQ